MLIPIRCFTCNKVIGDKYVLYKELSNKHIEADNLDKDEIRYMDTSQAQEFSPYGKALNELGLMKMCCRRHMLGHVDIIDDL